MFISIIVVFTIHENIIESQKRIHDIEMVEQKQVINLEYLDILERLYVTDNLHPFAPNVRSSVRIKQNLICLR